MRLKNEGMDEPAIPKNDVARYLGVSTATRNSVHSPGIERGHNMMNAAIYVHNPSVNRHGHLILIGFWTVQTIAVRAVAHGLYDPSFSYCSFSAYP